MRIRAFRLRAFGGVGMNGFVSIVLCGIAFGLGIVGLAATWRSHPNGGPKDARNRLILTEARRHVPLLVLAGVTGAAFAAATGWPMALPIVGAAVYGLPKLFGQTSGSASIAKVEAIATWTEMLQGTLAASAGLGQAIIATAALSPAPIRSATTRLSAQLGAGVHPRDALLQFSEDVGDPCADRVVCALLLAVTTRAQRLGDLLSALAESTRDEVALRLRIETSRASIRSGVRTVMAFSVAFAVGLALLAHPYLAPFGSGVGQLMLALVGALYAIGLTLMVSLSRPSRPVRLLGREVAEP